MIHITKDNFKEEIENAKTLTVIDLWAPWCGPCRMLAPVLDELETAYPDVKFCKINVDEEGELAAAFKVESIPMLAFVKDNTFLDFSVGFVPKANIEKMINEYK